MFKPVHKKNLGINSPTNFVGGPSAFPGLLFTFSSCMLLLILKSMLNYDYDLQITIHHWSLILLTAIINLKHSTQITSTTITPQLGNILILYAIAQKGAFTLFLLSHETLYIWCFPACKNLKSKWQKVIMLPINMP